MSFYICTRQSISGRDIPVVVEAANPDDAITLLRAELEKWGLPDEVYDIRLLDNLAQGPSN